MNPHCVNDNFLPERPESEGYDPRQAGKAFDRKTQAIATTVREFMERGASSSKTKTFENSPGGPFLRAGIATCGNLAISSGRIVARVKFMFEPH